MHDVVETLRQIILKADHEIGEEIKVKSPTLLLGAAVAFAVLPPSIGDPAPASRPCRVSLRQGHWQTPGHNEFWLRCDGDEVFWLGMNKATGDAALGSLWAHVGYGRVEGRVIQLRWADIPFGADTTAGRIEVTVMTDTTMSVSRDDGVFGRAEWHWVGP
jgi:hypothetical protein